MAYFKIKGIVIAENTSGDGDKILTILTNQKGKINCYAKGAKRNKSALLGGTQLLCYSDFVMYQGSELYSIYSCEVIESFYELRQDIIKLTYAAHLLEVLNDAIWENQPSNRVVKLVLNTLFMIAKEKKSAELCIRIFEFRLMKIIGYEPYINACISCGKNEYEEIYFNFLKCGFQCSNCKNTGAVKILFSTAKAIYHIISSPIENIFNFEIDDIVLKELASISSRYIRERLEKDYKKLDYIKLIEKKTE